jgi:hypothetical protein
MKKVNFLVCKTKGIVFILLHYFYQVPIGSIALYGGI